MVAIHLFILSGFSLKEVAKRTWAEMCQDDVFGRAAQLSYYFFLALFPFLICVIASLSIFGFADRGRMLLFRFLAGALPNSAFILINDTTNLIIHASGPLKMSFGIVASIWSASMGMSAVMDTLNAAYNVKETRSRFKQYVVATALTLAITVLLVAILVLVVFGDTILGALSHGYIGKIFAQTWTIAQWPLALILILLVFALIYYFAPNLRHREWHWATPGSVMGVIVWMAVSIALRIYLHFFNTYTATYGFLGGVIVLLLWFYLSGIAVLSGAALNAVLGDLPKSAEAPGTEAPTAYAVSSTGRDSLPGV